MYKTTIIILTILVLPLAAFSQSYSVSGYITDNHSRETIIGATVQIKNIRKAAVTDKNGFYSLTGVKPGTYTLSISHLGYKTTKREIIIINKGLVLKEIQLNQKPLALDEISIVAIKPDEVADKTIETSHIELTPQMIKSIPTAKNDVFKAIKYLPGVQRTENNSPLYTVRGGDTGENAVLLDGIMIYNPYHASISAGIFNTLSIKNVDLLLGGFGAEYGGRNSSVMYISTKDGNTNEMHGEIKPSTFRSQVFVELPVGKNSSMVVAGRYNFDIPYNFLFNSQSYFYDYNISYTNRINKRNRLTLKYFESKDYSGYNFNTFYKYLGNTFNFDYYDDFNLVRQNDWSNRAATVIHKLIITPQIYMRNQVYYSAHNSDNFSETDFEYEIYDETIADTVNLKWNTNNQMGSIISDIGLKTAITIKQASFAEFRMGAEYNIYRFKNSISINDIDNGTYKRSPNLLALFVEEKLSLGKFVLRPGLRTTNYNNTSWQYEPRINASLSLPYDFRLKAAYGKYLQYIISMNTNELEMTQIVDYYYPLQGQSPSRSTHYIFGIEKNIGSSLLVSADAYYKQIDKIYTFDINQGSVEMFGFTNKLYSGNGKAYGLEILLKGKIGKISGWASYSLSLATRQYPNSSINNGGQYDYEYNSKHAMKTVLSYQFTPNFKFNGTFRFLSGTKRTIETTVQSYYYYDPVTNTTSYFPLLTSNEKNNAQMPSQMYLDLSIEKRLKSGFGKKLADFLNADDSYVSITIQNLTFLYRNVEYYLPSLGMEGYEDKYIPIGTNYLPSVGASYTLKF